MARQTIPMMSSGNPSSVANQRRMQDAVNPEIQGAMNPIPGGNVQPNAQGEAGINIFEHTRHETPAQLKAIFSKKSKK